MSYMLGIHINTNRFSKFLNLNRNSLFREVSFYNITASGSFSLQPNYIAELPEFDPSLYQVSNYFIPKDMLSSKYKDTDLNMFNARLNSVRNIYAKKTIELMKFDLATLADNAALENMCISRINLLENCYKKMIKGFNQLKHDYSGYVDKIESFESRAQKAHLHVALLILEYGRVSKIYASQALIVRTLNICNNMYACFEKFPEMSHFVLYLLCFTYLSIIKHLDQIQRDVIISRVVTMFNLFPQFDEYNNLNYLMLSSALKIIQK